MDGFVHLHVHSHYSLLDGGNRIGDLIDQTKSLGMDSIALTDHGNLFGAVEFYNTATKAGIKPILGMEAYISPTDRSDRSMGNQRTASYHMVLLAMNDTGWRNLIKLSSRAYLEGFYYKPRIDRELLRELNEGLICTTACLGGEVPSALMANDTAKARRIAQEYLEIFGKDRFFIEIQRQGIEDQNLVNPHLVSLAKDLGVGIVGTNDVHFLTRDDKKAHEVLTCISTGRILSDGGALEYPPELYLKSPAEMHEALSPWPEAIANTLRIAEMCNVKLDFTAKHLPVFETPDKRTPDKYLRDLAVQGLKDRFDAKPVPDEYVKRLEWELKVIADKGYSSYFLIIHDFMQYARANNIPAAPRGSGVATLLGYTLRIADVDPIKYGLLFERFTDPAREEDPDIDIDICQEGRGKIIQYVRQKYGHVAQIITYGTLKARAAIRDVGRVLNIPLPEVDAISKAIPDVLKIKLQGAINSEPDLKKLYESDPRITELLDHAMSLEGLARHAGIHAAGVIVAQQPLENLVPLCKQGDSDDAITQWDGPTCEKAGLMKMDFLGLRTLTIIQRARELVAEQIGSDLDPEQLPLDDADVLALFCRGETAGVFQFESDGMQNVLMQMQPQRLEDLIAANAMYRPGPMELIPSYCSRKNDGEPVPSVHPLVDDILAETYGIMCYQEQVMQVLNRLGKLPLSRALTLIKAISKKKAKTIASEKPNFLAGAKENGITEEEGERLFDLILKFAGYGFNKAHSTRYAIVAYQTAYFKVHYPKQFLAATLTFECGDTDKVVQYMAEATRMKIEIAPPDINTCDAYFAVDGDQVRFGLAAVKGVGAKAVNAIVEGRDEVGQFTDLYHFCENVNLRAVNRSTTEALIKCGAFDALGAHRAAMLAALDKATQLGQSAAEDRKSGQMNFFGDDAFGADEPQGPQFPDVEPLSESQLLAAEKETLGFYVSSHPLVSYGRELDGLSSPRGIKLGRIADSQDGASVTIGCMITSVRPTVTKKDNRRMAMLTVEDLTGKCDAVVFPRTYDQIAELLQPEAIIFLCGTVDRSRERANIIIDRIIPIDVAVEELTAEITLRLAPGNLNDAGQIKKLHTILTEHQGRCAVLLEFTPRNHSDIIAQVRPDAKLFVKPSRQLMCDFGEMFDQHEILLRPKVNENGGNGRNRRYGRKPNNSAPAGQKVAASEAVTRFD